ncbi:ABC transporter permease [Mucilaginibacter sp. BJC16-A38]|uniref:ABC transporter permease n=1 Tax=Mucilaginibacter phenanthrenivorans TaxID=1234842 RepID=UPI002157C96A|nr:FtsX-like permease family protein [Mucilaginibacter phenanthrenivorans]MCR8560760.1 ABC transporter permease [Mucilaginibacter phenanthrenivorans]
MSFAYFIANRITFKSKRTFSKLIVRIAIVGIALGLAVMILSLAVVRGFKNEIRQKIRGFSGDMQVVKYDLNNSYENSPFTADGNFVKRAHQNSNVTTIVPFATKPGIIKAHNEIEGVILKGVDKTYSWAFFKNNIVTGTTINFSDSVKSKTQLLISQVTADRLRLKVGDKIQMYFVQEHLRRRPFVITGIFDTGIEEIDKHYVVGDLALINRLNSWKPDEIGGYEIQVADFDQLNQTANSIDDILPTKLKAYTVTENFSTIFGWLDLLDGNTQVVLVLMILVAVINMISALLIMIVERTAMIGILKAMGANNWAIQKVFLYNAFYLIGLGMLFGNIFGIGFGFFQSQTHLFKLDQASYYMSFVPIQFDWLDLILLNVGTLVVCLLVMVGPSMLVSRIEPVKAIQFK